MSPTGYLIVGLSTLFLALASYAILLSAFLPLTGHFLLDTLANDTHYKYFVIFLIPMSAYFIIANWVGWQYYQNS